MLFFFSYFYEFIFEWSIILSQNIFQLEQYCSIHIDSETDQALFRVAFFDWTLPEGEKINT